MIASLHKEVSFEVCDNNILEQKSKEAIMYLKYTETVSCCKGQVIKTRILEITKAWPDRGTWEQSRVQGYAPVIIQGSCSVKPAWLHPEHPTETGALLTASVDVESQHFIIHVLELS